MPATNFCPVHNLSRFVGVYVELLVNGIVVEGQSLYRQHTVDEADAVTLTGSTRIILDPGDVVQIRVRSVGQRSRNYQILPPGCSLSVKRERQFE